MLVEDDRNAAAKKFAATWAHPNDARLIERDGEHKIIALPAPDKKVFTVYISPNEMIGTFPDLFGWIEHWTWISEDPRRPGAPIDWQARYDEMIWSAR